MSPFSFSNLLRNRSSIIQSIVKREVTGASAIVMLAFAVLAIALYGGVMGSFVKGDLQAWLQHSEKLLKILMGSFLLSLPSLYIFSAFRGSKLTLGQLLMLSIVGFGTLGLVLIGFLPIAWFFTWISETMFFIRPLHVVMIVVSWLFLVIVIGQGLNEAYRWAEKQADKNARHGLDIYGLWVIVLLVVTIHMTAHLGPYFVREIPFKSITAIEDLPSDQILAVEATVRGQDSKNDGWLRAEYTPEGMTLTTTPHASSGEPCYEFTDYTKYYSECIPASSGQNTPAPQVSIGAGEYTETDFLTWMPFIFKGEMKQWGDPISREKISRQGAAWWKITYQIADSVPSQTLVLYEEKETGLVREMDLNAGEKDILSVKIESAGLRPRTVHDDNVSFEAWKRTLPYPDAPIQQFIRE